MVFDCMDFLLKQEGVTLQDLRDTLGMENNGKLLNALLIYLEKEISRGVKKDSLPLLKSFSFLREMIEEEKKISPNTFELLEKLRLASLEKKGLFYEEVSVRIDDIYATLEQNASQLFQRDLFGIAETVIFDLKDKNFFSQFVLRNPKCGGWSDERGNTLLYLVVVKFLHHLSEYSQDVNQLRDVSYYSMVIDSLLKGKGFVLEEGVREKILDTMTDYLLVMKEGRSSLANSSVLWFQSLQKRILTGEYAPEDVKSLDLMFGRKKNVVRNLFPSPILEEERIEVEDYIVTIDPVDVNEVDDGLSIRLLENGNYLLGVHIANPSGYFSNKDKILKEAKKRANTLYFEESSLVLPIFPQEVMDHELSLEPHQRRFATSYYLEVDRKTHDIVDFTFYKSIVCTKAKLSYEFVDAVLSGKIGCGETLKQNLELLAECVDGLSFLLEHLPEGRNSISEKMVEKCMVAVGSVVGNLFDSNKWPMLYRVHQLDCYEKFQMGILKNSLGTLENGVERKHLQGMIDGIFGGFSAYYSTVNLGHSGLRQPAYVHATSPLRRSADLYVEDAMNTMYFHTPSDREVYQLEERLKRGELLVNRQGSINDEYSRYYRKLLRKKN